MHGGARVVRNQDFVLAGEKSGPELVRSLNSTLAGWAEESCRDMINALAVLMTGSFSLFLLSCAWDNVKTGRVVDAAILVFVSLVLLAAIAWPFCCLIEAFRMRKAWRSYLAKPERYDLIESESIQLGLLHSKGKLDSSRRLRWICRGLRGKTPHVSLSVIQRGSPRAVLLAAPKSGRSRSAKAKIPLALVR